MAIEDAWTTDEALASARSAIAALIPGYRTPVAYALARKDGSEIVFGHTNKIGQVRGLPAAALALECGYANETGTYVINKIQLAAVLDRLAPAEAATHIPHPNIWTWRSLLKEAQATSLFLGFFMADTNSPAQTEDEAWFQALARDTDR